MTKPRTTKPRTTKPRTTKPRTTKPRTTKPPKKQAAPTGDHIIAIPAAQIHVPRPANGVRYTMSEALYVRDQFAVVTAGIRTQLPKLPLVLDTDGDEMPPIAMLAITCVPFEGEDGDLSAAGNTILHGREDTLRAIHWQGDPARHG